MKSRYCENDCNHWLFSQNPPLQMIDSLLNVPGFWIMPPVLNMPRLWIYQGSEYTRVLNLPGFWIYQGSEYVRIIQGSEYAWLCLNVWICVNMPKSIWMAFVLHCPIVIPCLLQHLDLFQSFTKLEMIVWRNLWGCFFEEIKFDLFIVTGSIYLFSL